MTRYRADPPALRRTIPLEDGMTLILHRPSATTHLVAPPMPEILAALEGGAAGAEELLERLRESYELDRATIEAITIHLADLNGLGLVICE